MCWQFFKVNMTEDFSQKALVWRLWYWKVRQRQKIFRPLGRRQKHWKTDPLDDWVTGLLSHWMTDMYRHVQHILTHSDTYRHVPTRTDTYQHVLTRTNMYRHVPTHIDKYRHVPTHTDIFWHVLTNYHY